MYIKAIAKRLNGDTLISPKLKRSLLGLRLDCYLDLEMWKEAIRDIDALLLEDEDVRSAQIPYGGFLNKPA